MIAQIAAGKLGKFKHSVVDMGEDTMEAYNALSLMALELIEDGYSVVREFDDLLTAHKKDVYLLIYLKKCTQD